MSAIKIWEAFAKEVKTKFKILYSNEKTAFKQETALKESTGYEEEPQRRRRKRMRPTSKEWKRKKKEEANTKQYHTI